MATDATRSPLRDTTSTDLGWLRLPCCDGAVHPVVIERLEGDEVLVTAPREPHSESVEPPADDAVLRVGWGDADGAFSVDCRFIEEPEAGLWRLATLGNDDFVQRRRHVRVSTTAPVQLLDHDADRAVPGQLHDLSEGGMRCSLEDWDPSDRPKDSYRLTLRLDRTLLVVQAALCWAGHTNGRTVAGFEFLDLHHSLRARIHAHVAARLAELEDDDATATPGTEGRAS